MRIWLLTYSTRPRGGVVHTLALAEALAARGHDVSVWSLARGGDGGFFRTVDPAVRVRLVRFEDRDGEGVGARILRSIDLLGAALREALPEGGEVGDSEAGGGAVGGGAAVVHAQDCISANAALSAGLDVVRTVHHLDRFTTPELVACHERAIRAPSAHVCVSHAVADELRADWAIGATVIPNGVDAARFAAATAVAPSTAAAAAPSAAADRAAWRRELGPYLLAVGGIEPRKGTSDLVEAHAALRLERPDLRLVIAGGETLFDYRPYRAEVEARAAELGLSMGAAEDCAVRVLGPVDHGRLPALVAGASAFAFPSTKEGFGLAAMEALAAGVPVVMRDLPVLREVFGSVVRFAGDARGLALALAKALDDVEAGRHAPERGLALARGYTWDEAARRHEDFYRALRLGRHVDTVGRTR